MRQLLGAYQTFVGHDLPNQLVSVQAYARLLDEIDSSGLDEEARSLLGRIGALGRQMALQARRLSEFGKLLGQPPWGPPLSLEEVAEEVVASVRCRTDAAEVVFAIAEGAPSFPLAGELFHQMIAEVVANAVAAIGTGRRGRIDVSGEWSPDGGTIRVSDTGVGISAERIDRLLRTTQVGGLLLVRQAAALWDGTLHIESAAGEGTTVTVTISATGGHE